MNREQPEPVASNYRGKCADDNHCSFSCLKNEPCLRSNYAARVLAERAAAFPKQPEVDPRFKAAHYNEGRDLLPDGVKEDGNGLS